MQEFKIEDFMNRVTIYQHSALSEDGQQLAYISNLTGHPQVWVGRLDPKAPQMLFPKPVTTDKDKSPHVMSPALAWIGSEKLVTMMDQHGDEMTFLEILNFRTGETELIPRGNGRDFLGFVSEDQKKVFFSSNRDELTSQGLYIYDTKTRKNEFIYRGSKTFSTWFEVKPWKGGHFFSETLSNQENHLKVIDLKTKKVKELFHQPKTLIDAIALLPKDKLLVVTNHERQFLSLAILDLQSLELSYFQKDQWDIEIAKISKDQKNLFVVRNVAGKSVLEHYSFPGLKKLATKFNAHGVMSSLDYSEKSKTLIIGFTSPTEPKNFYRLGIKSKRVERLTDTWISKIPEKMLSTSKLISYKSQDRSVDSWLYLPKSATKNKKTPVIVWPHGGPQWQERASFRPIFQYFVAQGFAIWAPNPAGSTGYGKDFTEAICKQWGTADLPDMLHGIEWLKSSGWIDPDRIAIMGGSYGGYMTLRSITKIPKTFKAAVDIFGVSNLFTFIKSVPEDWKYFMEKLVGNPEDDAEMLKEQSPVFSLEKIDCPLLVIQGARDPRVVKSESDQVVEKLKFMGKIVDYLVFDDEGHGFLKIENELKAYKAAAEFIEKYI